MNETAEIPTNRELEADVRTLLWRFSFSSDEERLKAFEIIDDNFCRHCGRKQSDQLGGCQCMNDD